MAPFADLRTAIESGSCESFTLATLLFSDTKCGIERNDFFIVLKAEVFGRELDSISGLVGVHMDL